MTCVCLSQHCFAYTQVEDSCQLLIRQLQDLLLIRYRKPVQDVTGNRFRYHKEKVTF
jgi:hypothetical protein